MLQPQSMVMNPRTIERPLDGDKHAFDGTGQFPIS